MLRQMRKDNEALIGILLIFAMLVLVAFGVFAFFFVQMLVQNILPIAIGIMLVIAVPIVAKGWYFKKTGKEYESKGGLF